MFDRGYAEMMEGTHGDFAVLYDQQYEMLERENTAQGEIG